MGIIIGSMTNVSFGGCAISVSWSSSSNVERFYCIGNWDPFLITAKPTQSLNITLYAPGPSYLTSESRSCSTTNSISATVDASGCSGGGGGVSGSWFVTSYSYSKDSSIVPGQESWSMTQWLSGQGVGAPTIIMRGIAEGEGSTGSGISFGGGYSVSASSGGVSANGIGRADTVTQGQVSGVGGGEGSGPGTGAGSASIPYTPLYI